jgi:hypothetical protein
MKRFVITLITFLVFAGAVAAQGPGGAWTPELQLKVKAVGSTRV